MAFAPAATHADRPALADINITPLVDVMLVLLVIFMVTAPLLDHRIGLTLPQATDRPATPSEPLLLRVDAGDLFRIEGVEVASRDLEGVLVEYRLANPGLIVKLDVDPEADYQSAATAMAAVRRAGIENLGLLTP